MFMKRSLIHSTAAMLCALSGYFVPAAFGQGSLQFNQVKLVTSQETVPAGKVWKVVSPMLGLNQGIRVSPFFFVNSDTIVLGYDSYNVSRWENVTSIVVQYRGNACQSPQIRMRFLGSGGGSAIDQDNTTTFNVNSSTFTTVATYVPPSAGNNEIDRWNFWIRAGLNASHMSSDSEFRVVINLANGAQIVETYVANGATCNNCSAANCWIAGSSVMRNIVGTSTATIALDRTDRNRPQISTPFPIWLPAGATLGAGGNVRGISVIEFNILP